MINKIFPDDVTLKAENLDDLFLSIKDTFVKIIKNDNIISQNNTIKINMDNYKLETELLDICYKCVYYGVNPMTCKILLESKSLEMLILEQNLPISILRTRIIISMIDSFYMHDINELYLRAHDICSPEVLHEIRKVIHSYEQT